MRLPLKHYIKLIAILVIATIALQGFQCASREMTTAKVAIKNGEIDKAIENLQKELDKNPKNGEAYILLAELNIGAGKLQQAIDYMDKAEPLVAKDVKLKDKPKQFKFEIFKSLLQQGEMAFNQYNKTKNQKDLESAVQIYSGITIVRPDFYEAYRMIGIAYEMNDKPEEAMKAYETYIKKLQPSIDIANKKKFFIGADRSVLSDMGKSQIIRTGKTNNTDSTVLEKYIVQNKDLFVYSSTENGKFIIRSWSFDPPKNILEGEREIVPSSFTQPISALASLYYNVKKDKQKSLDYFKIVTSVSPLDDNANSAIVTLYQELGKPEDAISAINENVKKNPSNPIFLAQLGDVYMTNKQYDNAIAQYEKAININPNFDAALRNISACYGNKAAMIQVEQNEQIGAGKMKAPDTTAFYPILKKAAEYFERTIETSTFAKDHDVIADLCGIYLALGKNSKDKFNETLIKLEALEKYMPQDKKERYYLRLLKIYGQTNNPKYSDIEKKLK